MRRNWASAFPAVGVTGAAASFDLWLWDFQQRVFSRLTRGGNNQAPVWTPDGRQLVYRQHDPQTDYDIWVLPIDQGMKPGEPRPVVASPARETYPAVSPDGRWLAYVSDESGLQEIYVQSFPGPGSRAQVSSGGGTWPKWGHRGDELFYVDPGSHKMMAASVRGEEELTIGAPRALFDFEATSNSFVVAPDGEHFVFTQRGSQAQPIRQLRIVFNWFDEVDRNLSETAGT